MSRIIGRIKIGNDDPMTPRITNIIIRDLTEDDVAKLTEIKIKRISKFDSDKADDAIGKLKKELASVNKNLKNIIEYAVEYFQNLLKTLAKFRYPVVNVVYLTYR